MLQVVDDLRAVSVVGRQPLGTRQMAVCNAERPRDSNLPPSVLGILTPSQRLSDPRNKQGFAGFSASAVLRLCVTKAEKTRICGGDGPTWKD